MSPDQLRRIRARYPEPTHGWSTNDEALYLYSLCLLAKCDRVIEGGTCNGWSTSWLAMALEDRGAPGKVHTFDIEEKTVIFEGTDIESRIDRRIAPFHEGIHAVAKGEYLRTLYFIDGDHTEVGVRNDWQAVQRYMRVNDIAVFHDTRREWKFPGIRDVLGEIRGQKKYEMCNIISLHGVATVRKCHKK